MTDRAAPGEDDVTTGDSAVAARRVIRAVVQTFLEIEAGCRPLTQLAGVLEPRLRQRLSTRLRGCRRGTVVDAIVSIRMCRVTPLRVDAAVVVRGTCRIGVVAITLERSDGGWRVTELARPEQRAAVA